MLERQRAIASLALLFFISSNLVAAQKYRSGSCPKVTPVKYFDPAAYLGVWHVYAGYPFFFELGTHCNKATYTHGPDNSTLYVSNTQIDPFFTPKRRDGTVLFGTDGNLRVKYKGSGVIAGTLEYTLLGTDYENYAIIYRCKELPLGHLEYLWIRTRTPTPDEGVISAATDVIKANKLKWADIELTDQGNCEGTK